MNPYITYLDSGVIESVHKSKILEGGKSIIYI